MRSLLISFFAVLWLCASVPAQNKNQSVYTDLRAKSCKTIKVDKETGSSVQRCTGLAGYKVLALDDDARQSITIIDPAGREHPLDLWQVVTPAFSSIGDKLEWRVIRKDGKSSPVALIVRVNASEDSANPQRKTSYLAVAKIAANEICVTDKISPGSNGNESARLAADASQRKPCLKGMSTP
jgi:hypothetical protein